MGLMDKFKNLFTEEVEEVKPIKKEVRHVEIASPKRSEIKKSEIKKSEPVVEEDNISDSTVITREEKFVFPVYFDDKDFDDLEKPKKVEEKKEVKESKPVAYKGAKIQTEVEEKKVFKPSPIISPVYGILDKNYRKDDIVTKTPKRNDYRRVSGKVTVDDIRDKAFGTLEDDLKNSLLNTDYEEKYEPDDDMLDMFNDLDFDKVNDKRYIEDEDDLEKSNYEVDNEHEIEKINISDNDIAIEDDEDTIILARQLEEQKKKLEELNDYINENEEVSEDIDSLIDNYEDEDNKIEEIDFDDEIEENVEITTEEENSEDDLTQSELLNLIDSMYDNKEE